MSKPQSITRSACLFPALPASAAARADAPGILLAALLAIASLLLQSCAAPALNSDRIAARYGSYQVTVLAQDERARLSSLESRHPDGAVTRTLALVLPGDDYPEAVAHVHDRIRAGASIGASFRAAGFAISKPLVCIDTLRVGTPQATRRMRIDPPATLALHVYRFDVEQDGARDTYATIVEMHHPDYLTREDLADIYGVPDTGCAAYADKMLTALAALPE